MKYQQTVKLVRSLGRVRRIAHMVPAREPVGQPYDAIAADECCSICGYLACSPTCIADNPEASPPTTHQAARASVAEALPEGWRDVLTDHLRRAASTTDYLEHGDSGLRVWKTSNSAHWYYQRERSGGGFEAVTRAEAMAAALGYTFEAMASGRVFRWFSADGDEGPPGADLTFHRYATAELAALDALRFDAEQRRAVKPVNPPCCDIDAGGYACKCAAQQEAPKLDEWVHHGGECDAGWQLCWHRADWHVIPFSDGSFGIALDADNVAQHFPTLEAAKAFADAEIAKERARS